MLVVYKSLAICSMFVSAFSVYYAYDRKVHEISKSVLFITLINSVASLLEYLKYETPYSLSLEKLQNHILFYVPALVYSFFKAFLSDKSKEESRKLEISLYVITILYSILALTNNLHNLFWTGTIENSYYVGISRPADGILAYTYYVFLAIVMLLVAVKLMKNEKLLFKTKYRITVIFSILAAINVFAFSINLNFTINVFTLSVGILIVEFVAVSYFWRRNSLGLRSRFLEKSRDGFIVTDNNGYVIDINQEALNFLDESYGNVIGRKNEFVESLLKNSNDKNQIIERSGKHFLFVPVRFDGGTVVSIQNISSEILAEKEKKNLSISLNSLFQNIPDGVAILTTDGKIVDCNESFVNMFGYQKDCVNGKLIDDLIAPENLKSESRELRELAISQKTLKANTIARRKDGKLIDVRLTVSTISTDAEELLYAIYTDVSAEKEIMKAAKNSIEKDLLTGLYSRFYFMRKLTNVTEFSSSYEYNAVIFVDIQDFRTINSSKGHTFGDKVLIEVARRLKSSLREVDTVARADADEFWILIEKVGNNYSDARERIKNILSKMLQELSKPYDIDDEKIEMDFHVAIYIFNIMDKVEEILRKGNLALENAKTSENRIAYYNIMMDNELKERVSKERDFREAFYNGNVRVFLQPICNYGGKMIGAEALLRWISTDGKIIPPAEFIHPIEENGMIVLVGEEVLRQVCEVLKKTKDRLPFVDVNISPVQLRIQNMADRFSEIILSNGVDPTRIVLEITENILIELNQTVKNNIDKLMRLGCQICIDDFGTGYSSLSYLTLFQLSKIKIDRSFVSKLPDDKYSLKLLEAVYDIARSFEIDAIPEGVENAKQLQILSMIGYKFFQGYYFAKPMPVDEFMQHLDKNS